MMPHIFGLLAAEDQVTLGGAALEYAGFLAYFGVFGALGFRFLVLRRVLASASLASDTMTEPTLRSAERGAAGIGLVGALLFVITLLIDVAGTASEKGVTLVAAISAGGPRLTTQIVLICIFVLAFIAALLRARSGWIVAAVAAIVFVLQNLSSGHWKSLVNPLHEVAASLWLGTLLVLVVAGLPAVLRSTLPSDRRGSLVAELIARFSPVALGAAALLGITGVTTAWLHLKYVAALWTTPYGYTLDVKLLVVLMVLALGAWNWRRLSPRLGTEQAAHTIRRSATRELSFAAVVLAITAVLVSLPSPKLPHP